MFAASEHHGLYTDACQLAEIILWGKGERGSSSETRLILHQMPSAGRTPLPGTFPTEMFQHGPNRWTNDNHTIELKELEDTGGGMLQIEANNYDGYYAAAPESINKIQEDGIPLAKTFQAYKTEYSKDEEKPDLYLLEILPPIALQHLNSWYIFDAPCITSSNGITPIAGMRCSALGKQSPVLTVRCLEESLGCWPLMPQKRRDWKTDLANLTEPKGLVYAAKASPDYRTEIVLNETADGGGRAFVNSWAKQQEKGEDICMKILWGGVSADFWDRTLNTPTPWSADKLGSFNRGEGVDGSLLETGASMLEKFGLGLTEAAHIQAQEATDNEDENYELVALASLRFMRDASVAYPTTIISFDAGSDGWALEMFDSVAINAVELAYYVLSGHFQL